MQASSAILSHVLLFNCFIIEKALSQITNMEHIFIAKSVKRGNYLVAPPLDASTSSVQNLLRWGNCLVAGLVTLHLFQNCFPRIFAVFNVCFLVFGAVMLIL